MIKNKYINKFFLFLKQKWIQIRRMREANELFSDGKIFKAKNRELNNVLRQISNEIVPNENVRHREIIRALVILNIVNQRKNYISLFFNVVFSLILIWLTISTYNLNVKQTEYVELSTRSDRINQNRSILEAKERCKNDPNLEDSGLYSLSGKNATCKDVLKIYK